MKAKRLEDDEDEAAEDEENDKEDGKRSAMEGGNWSSSNVPRRSEVRPA